ncbi:hypothetical protein FK178_02610 [Antarcticibacterium arcticum]|uniref:DUF481 domain-containing protein n=1 Tax=Antarcticibacterium arcticum TaxID=2585771 RepID=A0A5B8YGF4_9FLAO|nr:hypothetical protein [Antarcticibacterium arcticum]QED36671.1 hypothetical protein FK178_02610 [Antarcticibacterium arcticum]
MKQYIFLTFALLSIFPSFSQVEKNKKIRVFLDCQSYCDQDFIKREIPFVDYVNDRFQSNVFILSNHQVTGSGGRDYKLQFTGREMFAGVNDTLSFVRHATATDDEGRQQMVQTLKLGLVKYLARTEHGKNLQISMKEDGGEAGIETGAPQEDPWNLWVFNARVNAYLNGDRNYFSNSFSSGFSAARITEKFKTTTSLSYSVNRNRYGEGEDAFEFSNEYYRGNNTTVWALGDHWSAGGYFEVLRSDFGNYRSSWTLNPAIEYNFFPYSESNNHYVGLMYKIGPSYFDYYEETIYLQTEELRFKHNLSLDISLNKKWGQLSGSASYGHYFHDISKNRLTFSGYADLRLYKGLSLNLSGYFALQRDQLNIAKGDISNEDLLTRRRQLDSNYSFYSSFGIRYRFGSIFNNVVNPRFDGAGSVYFF